MRHYPKKSIAFNNILLKSCTIMQATQQTRNTKPMPAGSMLASHLRRGPALNQYRPNASRLSGMDLCTTFVLDLIRTLLFQHTETERGSTHILGRYVEPFSTSPWERTSKNPTRKNRDHIRINRS